MQIWNHDASYFGHIDVERPYGTAIELRQVRESTFVKPSIHTGKHRAIFVHADADPWDNATTWNVNDLVFIDYADWSNVTTYALNDYVTGTDGNAYRSIQASNLNKDPTSSSNRAWWRRVDFEYYRCLIQHSNKDPETFNANASSAGDRYWKYVFDHEALLDIDENNTDATLVDGCNALDFYGLNFRNSDTRTYLRIDSNNGVSIPRSLTFYKPHIHYIPDTFITVANAAPYEYDMEVQDMAIGAFIGRATSVSFHEAELVSGDSEGYNGFHLGTKTTLKVCTLINIHGGIIDGEGVDAIGVHVLPSMTANSNRNMVNTQFSLDGAGFADVVDPAEKLIYKLVPKLEVPELRVLNSADSTEYGGFLVGEGSPEGTVTRTPGHIFARHNALTGLGIYFKSSGSGNTNWIPMMELRAGTTLGRPSLSGNGFRGVQYFDADIGKPITHNGTDWFEPNGWGHPGYVAGRFYQAPLRAGTAGTFVATANRLYATLTYIGTKHSFDRIGLNCTVTASGNVRMGIYSNSGGQPGALVLDAGAMALATGDNVITINQALPPGFYWLGCVFDQASTLSSCASTTQANTITMVGVAAITDNASQIYGAHTYGALPDPFPTVVYVSGTGSIIMALRAT